MKKIWLYGIGIVLGLALTSTSWASITCTFDAVCSFFHPICGDSVNPFAVTGDVCCVLSGDNVPEDVPCECGDTVHTDTKLDAASDPVSSSGPGDFCSGDGLSVASGVTLDCDSVALRGDGSGDGIVLHSVSDVTVKNCNIREFDDGIDIEDSSDITLRSDKVRFNSSDGVDADDSSDLTIVGSFMLDNSNNGVDFDNVSSSTVQNSQLERNGDDGFQCDDHCTFVTVQNNQANKNGSDGIEFEESGNSNNFILNNVAKGNCAGGCSSDEGSGIVLEGDVTYTTVWGNQVSGNRRGIFLEIESGSPDNNTVSNNNAEKNLEEGILIESDNNTVSDNRGQKNGSDGLAVTGTGNTLSGNVFNFNAGYGVCTSAGNIDGLGNTGNGNGSLPNVNINGGC